MILYSFHSYYIFYFIYDFIQFPFVLLIILSMYDFIQLSEVT